MKNMQALRNALTEKLHWFVLALFIGWIIYNGICRLKNEKLRIALVILCVVAGWALTLISTVWPMCLPIALVAVGYLAAGREIARRDLLNKKLPLWCWLAVRLLLWFAGGSWDFWMWQALSAWDFCC